MKYLRKRNDGKNTRRPERCTKIVSGSCKLKVCKNKLLGFLMSYKKYTVIHHTTTAPGSGKFMTDYHLVLDYHLGRVRIYEHHDPDFSENKAVDQVGPVCYSVALVGNYDKAALPLPLLNALIHTLTVKIKRREIPAQIYGHCDIGKLAKASYTTSSPGKNVYEKLSYIRAQVAAALSSEHQFKHPFKH